ncbi:MAG TPA: winged helix-turn-helix domain-containing protein [Promineifilum sp.]|nr:winged helix-turn-helix domain-containing protein [Promineifilum sp.]
MTNSDGLPVEWDSGTAYDLFASLHVLHASERYGLRGSWAAGVRSRLPVAARDCLQRVIHVMRPLSGVYALPVPKDAAAALAALREMPPIERLAALFPDRPDGVKRILRSVAVRGAWRDEDLARIIAPMQKGEWGNQTLATVRKEAAELLDVWADPIGSADGVLAALECYHESFFEEEEARIRPALDAALARAQQLAAQLPQPALLEELSQGLRLAPDQADAPLVLAPSFWITPFVVITDLPGDKKLFLFGARPADVSLVPGEYVPDALHQALKALSEPTRLRILRYLTDEPMAPVDLARRLRLRPPTVIHHLDALRLARLVKVTLGANGKRYAARPGGAAAVFELLNDFLERQED